MKQKQNTQITFVREELIESIDQGHEMQKQLKALLDSSASEKDTNQQANSSVSSFETLLLHPTLKKRLQIMNYNTLTYIQNASFQNILSGKSCLMQSATGSGKTLAFALPMLQQILSQEFTRRDFFTLIISPTRELALQTELLLRSLTQGTILVTTALTGGQNKKSEKQSIRKGSNIIIGTIGRIMDHLKLTENFTCLLRSARMVIIDEIDQIMVNGGAESVSQLLEVVPKAAQKVFASATLSEKALKIIGNYVQDYVTIRSDNVDFQVPEQIQQEFVVCPGRMRFAVLYLLLLKLQQEKVTKSETKQLSSDPSSSDSSSSSSSETSDSADSDINYFQQSKTQSNTNPNLKPNMMKVLVFVESQAVCAFLLEAFAKLSDFKNLSNIFMLHGGIEQESRKKIWREFAEFGGVMISTDLASRGLNLGGRETLGVDLVVQFEAPCSVEQYVHRVGRTGRLGQAGRSLLFLQQHELGFLRALVAKSRKLVFQKPVDQLVNVGGDILQNLNKVQSILMQSASDDPSFKLCAMKAYLSFISGYGTKEGMIREFFKMQELHLGHICCSFGLVEQPAKIKQLVAEQSEKTEKGHGFGRQSVKSQKFSKPKHNFKMFKKVQK